MSSRKRLLIFAALAAGMLLLAIICWPYIFAYVWAYGLSADIARIESNICMPQNYVPAGKDLAVLGTFAKGTIDSQNLPFYWRPESIGSLNALNWYSGPDGAGAFFTGGFSHLSYRLEKDETASTAAETVWNLLFDDEGRQKHLDCVVVTENDRASFDRLISLIIEEYDKQIAENPSSLELLERKANFLLASGHAEKDNQ